MLKLYQLGLDEAGRGPWAGPMCVAGCLLSPDQAKSLAAIGVNDSKTLSASKRLELLELIKRSSTWLNVVFISAGDVDQFGLNITTAQAMKSIYKQASGFTSQKLEVIVDGNIDFVASDNSRAEIKADGSYVSVAAASIVAKTYHDLWMRNYADKLWPDYGFSAHVGYGTKSHRQAIETYGLTPIHRRSFKPIQQFLQKQI